MTAKELDSFTPKKELPNRLYRLKARIARLTGHAFDCEIQFDPEFKPCTCGRG